MTIACVGSGWVNHTRTIELLHVGSEPFSLGLAGLRTPVVNCTSTTEALSCILLLASAGVGYVNGLGVGQFNDPGMVKAGADSLFAPPTGPKHQRQRQKQSMRVAALIEKSEQTKCHDGDTVLELRCGPNLAGNNVKRTDQSGALPVRLIAEPPD